MNEVINILKEMDGVLDKAIELSKMTDETHNQKLQHEKDELLIHFNDMVTVLSSKKPKVRVAFLPHTHVDSAVLQEVRNSNGQIINELLLEKE